VGKAAAPYAFVVELLSRTERGVKFKKTFGLNMWGWAVSANVCVPPRMKGEGMKFSKQQSFFVPVKELQVDSHIDLFILFHLSPKDPTFSGKQIAAEETGFNMSYEGETAYLTGMKPSCACKTSILY
jgi:hypothetical protein